MAKHDRSLARRQARAVMAGLVSGALLAVGTVTVVGTAAHGSAVPSGSSGGSSRSGGTVRSVDLPGPRPGTASVHLRKDGVPHFSLIGVTWDEATELVEGRVRVRAHGTGSGRWTDWTDLGSEQGEEGTTTPRRGGTEPVWVGDSDGIEVSIDGRTVDSLPTGLRLDLVDPDDETASGTSGTRALATTGDTSPRWEPAAQELDPTAPALRSGASATTTTVTQPDITPRSGWEADESLREQTEPNYSSQAPKVVFVHHTATTSDYACSGSAAIMRSMYSYHVTSLGWRDLGYDFVVDRCGTIFEGRHGGIERGVIGAHTYGFNTGSTGISVIGTYTDEAPSVQARKAVARLAAWKLGLAGMSPTGTARLTEGAADSVGFTLGETYTFQAISGHRDGYDTECPGQAFYDALPEIRAWAADPASL